MEELKVSEVEEAIILCGGDAWRLKPDIWIPKPMLQLNKWTLLEHQLKWLIQNKFKHIIIASDKEYTVKPSFNDFIVWSIETFRRGTGGAVMVAIDHLKGKGFYLLNVDDICMYNPILMLQPDCQARIVVSKPRLGFGTVELRQDLVMGFKEKPFFNEYVSAGHYFFKKHIVEQYFPDVGNLEETVLPKLARERKLENYRLPANQWITINTVKDYNFARDIFSETE